MATHVSIQHTPDSMVMVHQYLEYGAGPLFTICSPDTHLVLSAAERAVITDDDLAFARSLAKGAADYLRHCEELRAARQAEREEVPA
jgi:hypothetical protein